MAMNDIIFHLRDPFDRTMERGLELLCSNVPQKGNLSETIQFFVTTLFYLVISPLSVALFGLAGALDTLNQRYSKVSFTRSEGNASEKFGDLSKIATFNVCMLFGGLGIKFGGQDIIARRIDKVAQKIISSDADVVCLQEVSPPAARLLRKKLEGDYKYFIERINPETWFSLDSGLFIVSKLPIDGIKVHSIPLAATMKRALFTFQVGKTRIGTTHLEPGNEDLDIAMRKKQVKEILKHDVDILIGDLNIERGEEFLASGLAERFGDGFSGGHTTTDSLSIDYILSNCGGQVSLVNASDCSDHHMLTMNC